MATVDGHSCWREGGVLEPNSSEQSSARSVAQGAGRLLLLSSPVGVQADVFLLALGTRTWCPTLNLVKMGQRAKGVGPERRGKDPIRTAASNYPGAAAVLSLLGGGMG